MLNDAHVGTSFSKVYLLTGYTDMRKGITQLASLIEMQFKLDAHQKGVLFLFCGRNRHKLKGLLWEGDGYLLLSKNLTDGKFVWPNDISEMKDLTDEQYQRLMSGFAIESSIRCTRPKYIG